MSENKFTNSNQPENQEILPDELIEMMEALKEEALVARHNRSMSTQVSGDEPEVAEQHLKEVKRFITQLKEIKKFAEDALDVDELADAAVAVINLCHTLLDEFEPHESRLIPKTFLSTASSSSSSSSSAASSTHSGIDSSERKSITEVDLLHCFDCHGVMEEPKEFPTDKELFSDVGIEDITNAGWTLTCGHYAIHDRCLTSIWSTRPQCPVCGTRITREIQWE